MGNDVFEPEWIWGDDEESVVYAQAYGSTHTIIFSFQLDVTKSPTGLANRLCSCYHDLPTADESATFTDKPTMRKALWDAVRLVWALCLEDHEIGRPDAVVNVDCTGPSTQDVTWKVIRHPLYQRYIKYLGDESLGKIGVTQENTLVEFSSLTRYEQLGGRGCATRVSLKSEPNSKFFVFKGIDFRVFLTYTDGQNDTAIRHMICSWHDSHAFLAQMPPHLNIMPASRTLVILRDADGSLSPVTCGVLQPLFRGGDLGSRIERRNAGGERISLALKAHWCAEMVAPVVHTHRVAHAYHMDIKPGNYLIDDAESLLMIDWERTDAPATTIAPEADGTWDVCEEEQEEEDGKQWEGAEHMKRQQKYSRKPQLRYTKYVGPSRRNVDEAVEGPQTWNFWNVFPLWNREHPFALELAEVFSLGRSAWMLLRQPDMDFDEVEHPDDLVTDWNDAEDIPRGWKDVVDRCMAKDPNERPDLVEVAEFWEAERRKYTLQVSERG